jgi:hypothetical protein
MKAWRERVCPLRKPATGNGETHTHHTHQERERGGGEGGRKRVLKSNPSTREAHKAEFPKVFLVCS